jgi:hypothetical protein
MEGAPWTPEESIQLRDRFNEGKTLLELALVHRRTPAAIVSRLVQLHWLYLDGRRYLYVNPTPFATFETVKQITVEYQRTKYEHGEFEPMDPRLPGPDQGTTEGPA